MRTWMKKSRVPGRVLRQDKRASLSVIGTEMGDIFRRIRRNGCEDPG